jgi:3-oxoacyl-[acyl-carrier protein] reductase
MDNNISALEQALNDDVATPVVETAPVTEAPATEAPATEAPAPTEAPATDSENEEAPVVKEEAPQFATKRDVIDAMREYEQGKNEVASTTESVKNDIISILYPEGVDTKLYDSNGEAINTAQDIVDRKLVNPNTNEPFTYEQAASWILNSQRQVNEQVEQLNKYAEDLAHTNMDLIDGNQRVLEKWGDVLEAMPGVARQLQEAYMKTLTMDESGQYVVKASINPVEFYDIALAPYKQLGEALVRQQELEAAQQGAQAVNERDERVGIPQRGTSNVKANTGDEFLDALVDELEEN